jgi:energy-coupling factor transport system permease protein
VLSALLLPRSPLAFAPALALFAAAAGASRLPARVVLAPVPSLGWLLLVTLLFQVVFLPGAGEPLATLGPVAVTEEALVRGLSLAAALLLTLLFASLLALTTSPIDVADALRAGLAPLRRVRAPVEDLALLSMIALRFVPTLVDEAERIRKAQVARGLRPARGPLGGARALVPLLVPLVEGVFRKADLLAVALEARGYVPGAPRVPYRELRFRAADALALALAAAAAAATAALTLAARGAP